MNKPIPEQMDWMRHCLQLNRDRLKKPHGLGPEMIKRLGWIVDSQQATIEAIERGLELSPVLEAWAGYLTRYAQLQIARRARTIEESAFFAGCMDSWACLREALEVCSERQTSGMA
ncbi:MAG: hypothetical protein K8L99_15270 [Anaerolineae bacterium]|nr:hypothetical protein [Anaerolineae bacterium]